MKLKHLILFLFIISACSSETNNNNNNNSTEKKTSKVLENIPIKYALGFTISQYADFKILEVKNPWQGAQNISLEYLLYSDITPDENTFPNAIRVKTPIQSIVCMSTTHIGFLDKLNELQSIVGIANKNLIYNSEIRNRIKSGKTLDIGYDKNLNYEKLISINPDLILSYSVSSELSGVKSKLEELKLKMILNAEYLESHPLGKAEWIKFIAAFYNKEDMAEEIFSDIETEYLKLTQLSSDLKNKPTIFTGLPWKGTWYISGGKSYPAKLISDAGGEFIWSQNLSHEALPLSIEAVYEKAAYADIWINSGYANTQTELLDTDERIKFFKAYQTGRVFNNNKRINEFDGNDYWESGIVNPHIILKDLIIIFHPEIIADSTLFYYKKLTTRN